MKKQEIRSFGEAFNGKTPSKEEQRNSGQPILKIRDIDEVGQFRGRFESFVDSKFYDRHSKKKLHAGDTIILNAAHNTDYVGGKNAFVPDELHGVIATGEWLVVRVKDANSRYVNQYLKSPPGRKSLKNCVKGIHLYPKDVERISVPLPSLDDQIRIAHLLGKVEGLIDQRKQHLQQLDDLLKSVFLEMFGYLEPNVLLGRECKFSQGIQIPMEEQFSEISDGRVRFLRIIDFTQSDQPRYIVSPGDRYCVEKDDIVMVRYGASAGFVGFGKTGAIANNLFKFNFDKKRILPPYLYHCLKTGRFDAFIRKKAFGAAMPALSFGIIHDYSIAVPPIDLQNQFATIVEKVENIKSRYQQSLSDLEALYGTLSQRAFKGELDLTRVPLPSTQPEEKKVVTVEPQEYQK